MTDYLQEQFIGKTFNEKLNGDMAKYLAERKFSVLGFLPRPGAIAMVHTLDQSGGIKALGGSDPFDIINNNFGKWLAAMHTPLGGGVNPANSLIGQGVPPVDITNTPRTVYYYNNGAGFSWNGFTAGVSSLQVGSGVTAPTVSDFNIETPFVGGPEASAVNVIGSGGYNPSTGLVSVGTNIGPASQIGTINELCLFTTWRTGSNINFLMSHDAISPAVSFIVGETIFAQYFFQL